MIYQLEYIIMKYQLASTTYYIRAQVAWKGGSFMTSNFNVTIDWKSILASGAAIGLVILSKKVDSANAEKAISHLANAFRSDTIANSDC